MVYIHPNSFSEVNSKSYAEKKLYTELSFLDDNWHVWHSKEWSLKKFGEADFVVFNIIYGFIILEVKGGKIELIDNNYYTTPLKGKKKVKIRDPFVQARESMFAICALYINEAKKQKNSDQLLLISNRNQKKFEKYQFPGNFTSGVVFWDCFFKEGCNALKPTNVEINKIYDASDIHSGVKIEDYLLDLFRNLKIQHLPEPVKKFFPKFMSGNIKTNVSLFSRIENFNQQLKEINIEQDKYLALLRKNKIAIIQGSAGTGKTCIAIKKLMEQHKKGDNCLFLCYNREIRYYVWDHIKKTYFSKSNIPGNIYIENIHTILIKISEIGNTQGEHQKFLDWMRNFHDESIQSTILDNILKIINRRSFNLKFDAIMLDECQDIPSKFAPLLKKILRKSDKSIFYIFYDDAQNIFDSNFNIDDFGLENPIKIDLPQNLRNVDSIINWFTKSTGMGNYPFMSGLEGMPIEEKIYPNYQESLLQVIRDIRSLTLTSKVSPERIIVLGEKKLKSLADKKIIKHISFHENDFGLVPFYSKIYSFTDNKKIILIEPDKNIGFQNISNRINGKCILYNSIGTFKGLERDFIHLIIPDIRNFANSNMQLQKKIKKRIYVGASRARFQLFIYHYAKM